MGDLNSVDKNNKMVKIPGGTFQMYSQKVTVSSFSISKFDIKQGEWVEIMGDNPSHFNDNLNNPVENVSWYDAVVYCNKRSIKEGLTPVYSISGSTDPSSWGAVPTSINSIWNTVTADWFTNGYRLPTEMEWMWAAMGADTANPGQVNLTGYNKVFAGSTGANGINDYAWTNGNSGGTTHPVGTKLTNELGLYNMSGNVWQWCWDWYRNYPMDSQTDYRGTASGTRRVLHGGSWYDGSSYATVAYRADRNPFNQLNNIGFRVVRP